MKRRRTATGRNGERGLVITLVAVVLLFVVGAMAVLAIDVATFYTARSEAQLAADGTALSAARALANSGMTSNANINLVTDAERVATILALEVAAHNQVGGRNLVATVNCANEVCITFNNLDPDFGTNPHVTVTVRRADLPTFFARIWGRNLVTVQATAVAEAYNPSGFNITSGGAKPVAAICVKPWVLPNLSPDPTNSGPIFNSSTGVILKPGLIGWTDPASPPQFVAACTGPPGGSGCDPWPPTPPNPPLPWQYYPGDYSSSFPPPTQALPSCSDSFTAYQQAIAGCVTTPITCNQQVSLDQSNYSFRNRETAEAVNCLTHCENGSGTPPPGDQVAALPPTQAFQFLGGADNPIAGAVNKNVLVSDSLVTVPVSDVTASPPAGTTAQIIGFVQLFLNPDGQPAPTDLGQPHHNIKTTIVNLVGCGTSSTGTPIYGNGPSAVAVRLIHH